MWMKTMETQMNHLLRPMLVFGACLLATVALAAGPQAEDKKTPKGLANFEAGIAAYQANDLPLAYKEFLAAAKEGHADSQFNLALMYEKGIGVGKDEKVLKVFPGKPVRLAVQK